MENLLERTGEDNLQDRLHHMRKLLRFAGDKLLINNTDFEDSWRRQVRLTESQIISCKALINQVKGTGLMDFDLEKNQNNPV